MKKRTGAHGAMAELLSKSNETQIKESRPAANAVRRPAPAKNPEVKRINTETKGNVQRPAAAPAARPAGQMPTMKAAPQMRATQTVNQPRPVQPKPAPATINRPAAQKKAPARKAKKTVAVKFAALKNKLGSIFAKIPPKVPLYAVGAILVIAGVAVLFRVAISTISVAAFEPDAVIGTELQVSEAAPALKISSGDETKHDGRNYITISIFEGEEYVCSTGASTVGDVLENMSVTVEGDYVLRGNETDSISSDAVISIDKVTYGTVTEETAVPFETRYVDVQTIARGRTKVTTAGKNGVSTATFKVTYVNGVETERVLESQVVTTQPTTQVVTRGVGGTITIGGKTYSYSHYIDCKTTVYTGGGITASGLPATEQVIAVDPRVIPLGTKVYVSDSYCYVGFRTAADTGGVIKGNFIDIYFDEDNPSLWGYGVRSARVYILD